MRKVFFSLFLILSIIFIDEVNALEYKTVTKRNLMYEINGFYIEGDYLIVNGWATSDRNIQNYFDETTHSYSLILKKYGTNDANAETLLYEGTLLPADKTILFKYASTTKKCSSTAINKDLNDCYMILQNVGFEFKIPLADLDADSSYKVTLRMYSKQANVAYQTDIFAPSINEYHEKNGLRYELYSDFSTTNIIMLSDMLFVKEGPSTSSKKMYSYLSCSATQNVLYWKQWEVFTNLQEISKTANDYSSETWFRVLFDQGKCINGRSRAFMGYTYTGWMPSVYTDFDGKPATIKITTQNHSSIDQVKTYTSPKNTQTKAVLKLYNKINQQLSIKLYQDNTLMYDNNIAFEKEKELTINFNNNGGSEIKVVITEPSGYVTTLKSPIYISSYNEYTTTNKELTIIPNTPIITITDETGIKKIYEKIKVSIPYSFISTYSGKPIQTWSYIEYSTDNNEINLNSNISGSVLFPSKENTLNYNIVNNRFKVETIKTSSNSNQAVLNLPEYVLDNNRGYVYEKGTEPSDVSIIYGDRKWYIPMNEELGNHQYIISNNNLGVNRITINFNCEYNISKTLFGYSDSLYTIKRTNIPNNVNYIFSKYYNYEELFGGR